MNIPKTITILGHTIKIKIVKVIPGKGMKDNRGLWYPDKNIIYIVNNPTNPDLMEQTLWHETSHAILDNMSRLDLSNDEVFVDMLGSMIHQVTKSATY